MGGGGASDIIGSVAGIAGADLNASAVKSQNEFNKNQTEFNNKVLDIKKQDIFEQSEREITDYTNQVNGMLGKQKTSMAAQGIEVDGETAHDIEDQTKGFARDDIESIKSNAWKKSWGIDVEQDTASQQNKFDSMAATNSAKASIATAGLGFASSIAKNSSGIASMFKSKNKKTG